jgi:hypothetical protein
VKRYQKVEDLISLAARFHGEVGEACRKLAEQEGQEKANVKDIAERLKKT